MAVFVRPEIIADNRFFHTPFDAAPSPRQITGVLRDRTATEKALVRMWETLCLEHLAEGQLALISSPMR